MKTIAYLCILQLVLLGAFASQQHQQEIKPLTNNRITRDFIEKHRNDKALKTIHIRNGTITGQTKNGVYTPIENGYRAAIMDKIDNGTVSLFHLQKGDFSVDISYLESVTIFGVIGAAICFVVPGCVAAVGAKLTSLASSPLGQAALSVITRQPAGRKRSGEVAYEEFGCVDDGGNLCSSPISDAIIKATDSDNNQPYRQAYAKVTNPDDKGSLVGWSYYCAHNTPCSFGEGSGEPVDDASVDYDTYN